MRSIVAGLAFFICILPVAMGCSARQDRWYKPGAYQSDFNLDCNECERLADATDMQNSVSGQSRNLEMHIKTYNTCLFSKGWSHTPNMSASRSASDKNPRKTGIFPLQLSRIKGNHISGFGQVFVLPAGFMVLRETPSVYGPTQMTTAFCQGPGPVFLNIVFQSSDSSNFETIDYPVLPPFFLFDKSKGTHRDGFRWSAFCGMPSNEWVGGIGAYLDIDSKQRIVVVATRPLPAARHSPPPGLRLTAEQYQSMATFTNWFSHWLHEGVRKSDRT